MKAQDGEPTKSRSSKRRGAQAAAFVTAMATLGLGSVGTASAAPAVGAVAKAPGSATSGSITWEASTITTGGTDPRAVLIQTFEKMYPNIHVTLITAPSDTDTDRATLTTQISGGGGPDVFMGDVIWPAQFGAHQLAVPLSKYLPASYWATFAPGLVTGATYKGQVYGSPLFEDQGFLYYRKDILAEDNLTVPKTWEQLVSDSKIAQGKGQVQYGYVFQGASYEGATCDFMEFLADAGGTVLNKAGTKTTLDSKAAIKALTFMASLVTTGVSPKAESTYEELQSLTTFDAGDSLFLRNWDYVYSSSQSAGSAVIGKVGVAPMPTFQGQTEPGFSNIGGWNDYINPHSKNIAADLTFIKFLSGVQGQDILAGQFSEIPVITSVRNNAQIKASNVVLAVVPETRLVPRPANNPNYSDLSQAIYQNVNAALAGGSSPTSAIKSAASGVTTAINGGGL